MKKRRKNLIKFFKSCFCPSLLIDFIYCEYLSISICTSRNILNKFEIFLQKFSRWKLHNVYQKQISSIHFFSGIIGASRLILIVLESCLIYVRRISPFVTFLKFDETQFDLILAISYPVPYLNTYQNQNIFQSHYYIELHPLVYRSYLNRFINSSGNSHFKSPLNLLLYKLFVFQYKTVQL